MKITKLVLALGMVLSSGLAHASLGEGGNCSANPNLRTSDNQNNDRQIVADATANRKNDSNSSGDASGAKDL